MRYKLPELTTQENKIINDILFHLDGWRVNDHPHETRKIESFLDADDVTFDNMVRKEVSSREVLRTYDMAKIHALNYIRRNEFPNNPSIYLAICYWAAGLLSEKAHFRDDKIDQDYSLIEEARRLLEPYIKRGEDFFLVRGDEFYWEDYMRSEVHPHPRRDRVHYDDGDDEEEKERLIHGHFHELPKDHFHYRPKHHKKDPCHRKRDKYRDVAKDWIRNIKGNKFEINTNTTINDDYNYIKFDISLKRFGKPCKTGKVMIYVYEDD